MSDNDSRENKASEDLKKAIKIEEDVIKGTLDKMDLSQLLENDFLTVEVELVPGKLAAVYRSPYDGEIFETEEDADTLEIKNEVLRELYRYRRALAVSLVSINGVEFMPGAGVGTKVEGLKKKPKHLVEKLLWGHILFQEALSRLLSEPGELEEKTKNS